MTEGLPDFGDTLYDCASQCAYNRLTKKCKRKFGSNGCLRCNIYIHNFIDADPRHVRLYMMKAESRARQWKRSNRNFVLAAAIGISLAISGINVIKHTRAIADIARREWLRNAEQRYGTDPSTIVVPSGMNINVKDHAIIMQTLRLVADDLRKHIDINGDGEINCIDAAVAFYRHYPYKDRVTIELNQNPNTSMNHLFNCVLVDGVWRALEPQTIFAGHTNYWMTPVWGREYDKSYNVDVTNEYVKYIVRR